ncbi:hypothetical protein NPX13_g11395 [Xylaria arbuscula]|uniref:Uncharacterized protein n=1 Tax=Xylaria arbuscula TaxID=114810 RepID=A0A9W8N2S6_9PEZI|nr:hypothetical protein NPX13_g11395 [Xylaria arbuscula]
MHAELLLLVVKYAACYTSKDRNFESARKVSGLASTPLRNRSRRPLTYQEYRRPDMHEAQGSRSGQDLQV